MIVTSVNYELHERKAEILLLLDIHTRRYQLSSAAIYRLLDRNLLVTRTAARLCKQLSRYYCFVYFYSSTLEDC